MDEPIKTDTDTSDPIEKAIRIALIGNLATLGVRSVADTNYSLIDRYFELMKESPKRQFHTIQYIYRCLEFARKQLTHFDNTPLAITAILFHVIGYVPRDKKSARRSCQIAIEEFGYPGNLSVKLIGLIKATQFDEWVSQRHGDDRDLISDIANHLWATESYDELRGYWSQILCEFKDVGYHPRYFKKYSRCKLQKMLSVRERCGRFYHTSIFSGESEGQVIENLERLLVEELSR